MNRMLSSLKVRLSLSIIAILVVGIGITAWRNIQVLDRQLLEIAKERADLLLDNVHSNIVSSMLERQRGRVQELLDALKGHQGILAVRILSEDGLVLSSNRPSEVGSRFPVQELLDPSAGTHSIIDDRTGGAPILRMSRVIRNEKRCFECHDPANRINGIVSVDVSLAPSRAQIAGVRRLVLSSAAVTVVAVFLAIWIYLSRTVTRPVSLLIKGMKSTETGDFSTRVSLPRRDEFGQLAVSFNTMAENVTSARRELEQYHEQQMMRAEKMVSLGQLASSIAHEIKNPLAGISGAMQVLASEFSPEHPDQEIIKEIRGQVDRLNQVVQNLLDFAKPSQPRFVEADIHEILSRALFLMKQQARELGIEIKEDFSSGLPPLWVDERQIQQVFLNIGLNALQAMGRGGKLTIRTSSPGTDAVEVDFEDTGPGISPEHIGTVFQPFFTTKPKGTGLGLAIVQRILREHGGEVRLRSEPGKGTCFTLSFPAGRRDGTESPQRQEEWHAAL